MAAGLKELGEFLSTTELGEFRPEPYYEKATDSLVLYLRDCRSYSTRLNRTLTLFLANDDNSLVGVEVKGVSRLLDLYRKFFVAVVDDTTKLGVLIGFALVEAPTDRELERKYEQPLLERVAGFEIPKEAIRQLAA